jgi:hypothetical protein
MPTASLFFCLNVRTYRYTFKLDLFLALCIDTLLSAPIRIHPRLILINRGCTQIKHHFNLTFKRI